VADVVELYSAATSIARVPEEFVVAIDDILAWSPDDRTAWQQRAEVLLAAHDWNQIVEEMATAMELRRFVHLPMTA
jgi:hypothetical protein